MVECLRFCGGAVCGYRHLRVGIQATEPELLTLIFPLRGGSVPVAHILRRPSWQARQVLEGWMRCVIEESE